MEFEYLLELVADEPVFETGLLLAGDVNSDYIRVQLARWVKSGRIYQLRRGLYALAPPFQKIPPHPFLIANRLKRASYVSLHSALAYYGLIPEVVNSTISVTTGRPERLETLLGIFEFRHVKSDYFAGYQMADLGEQQAFIALPEKAILDSVYLQSNSDLHNYLIGLRLQNLEMLDLDALHNLAVVFNSSKMIKAADEISSLALSDSGEFEDL